jgi:hydroxymethylbilane synthase
MTRRLRLGTRGSPLALAQARLVQTALAGARAADDVDVVAVRTSGDAIQDRPLAEAGGKGLFTKELDAALLAGDIDLAVHSAKDLPTDLPEGIVIAGYLPREDARDVLVAREAASLAALPPRAVVGSASLRREALVRRLRPDVKVVLLRGNIETRLRKVESGAIDATLLALAGLKRLGLASHASAILDPDAFLPAVGQGAVAVTVRAADAAMANALAPILDRDTGIALACERAFLRVLDGSCRTPIAGLATIEGANVRFRGLVLRRNGSGAQDVASLAPIAEAERCGEDAGRTIRARLPADFFAD